MSTQQQTWDPTRQGGRTVKSNAASVNRSLTLPRSQRLTSACAASHMMWLVYRVQHNSPHRSPLAVVYLVLTRSGCAPYEHAFWITCSLPTGTIFSLPYPVLFWKHTEHHNSQSKWKGWVSTSLIFSQVPRETFAISFNTHTLSGARAKMISRSGYVGKKKGTKLTITVTQVASP